jgi:hypothetical protein
MNSLTRGVTRHPRQGGVTRGRGRSRGVPRRRILRRNFSKKKKEIRRKEGTKGKEGIFQNTALQRINFVERAIRNNRTDLRAIKYFSSYYLVTLQYRSLGFIANTQRERISKTNSSLLGHAICMLFFHHHVSMTLSVVL